MTRKRTRTLADWLAEREMTQTEFARLLGVSQPIVSRWIKGDRLPSRRHWKAIRQVTGLSIASVVNFTAKRAA